MQSAFSAEPTSVGSVGIRIAQIPAEVAEQPYANVYIINRLHPGVPVSQRLEVFNTSSQEFKVDLYPGLATFINGKFEIGEGRSGNDLTSWIKLTPSNLKVKPGETKPFTVNISPPTDAPSIQQYGVIWAEVQGEPNASGITSISRVGIRIYVPVGNSPEISILETSMTSSTNEIIVKKSLISKYMIELIIFVIFLALLFLALLLLIIRRGSIDRKFRRENEKRLELQWKRERARRRKVWKDRKHFNQSRGYEENPYDDN
jgi:hypothetical protein